MVGSIFAALLLAAPFAVAKGVDWEKYDAVWQQNQIEHRMTGQGGVPTMSWNGDPFFGQDRFNQLLWRLPENSLAVRKEPRAPFVAKPLRWPENL